MGRNPGAIKALNQKRHEYLFLVDSLEVGGIQRQLLEVCRYLCAKGDKCVVGSFRAKPSDMASQFRDSGAEVLLLGKKRLIDFSFLLRLRKVLRNKYDLIHAMTPQTAFWTSCVMPRRKSARFISSLLNAHQFDKRLYALLESILTARRADAVFVNSKHVEDYYRKKVFGAPPIWRIFNGVSSPPLSNRAELRRELGIADNEFTAVCVGRLEPIKRHVDVIKAFSLLKHQGKNARLFIIGDGRLRRTLEDFTKTSGLERDVVFLGKRDDVQRLLCAFDVFILPSRSEGFCNALIEAMAAGLPCIATHAGGNAEAVEDEISGLLVPPKSPQHLVDSIIRLMSSADLRENLGNEAKRRAQNRFGMDAMLHDMTSHYERLIKGRHYDLAYLLSQFPKVSETFILREIIEMNKRGLSCRIISLKSSKEGAVHKEADPLMRDVLYLRWFSGKIFMSNLKLMVMHPVRYFSAFGEILGLNIKSLVELLKAFAVWWKTAAFAAILKKEGVRHIHAHWATMPTSCAAAMAKITGCRFSFTAHAWDIYGKPMSLKEKIQKSAFVTTCTQRNVEYLQNLAHGSARSRIHLVRHFLSSSLDSYKHNPSQPPVILTVGSLEAYKGHNRLLHAFSLLLNKGFDARLRIIGAGPLEGELKNLSEKLKIAGSVQFLGRLPQHNVFEEMSGASLFALASLKNKLGEDNLPNVIIEASMLKVSCIVSDLGSIREFIQHGVTGLLVEPGNIEQMAHGMEALLKDASLREQLAENARRKAMAMFDKDKNAETLEKKFKEFV